MKTAANVRIAAKVSKLVLHGLYLLQRWSCVVLECMAWKYTHPCSQADFVRQGGDPKGKGMEYEKVVRYNWTPKELSALVEVTILRLPAYVRVFLQIIIARELAIFQNLAVVVFDRAR